MNTKLLWGVIIIALISVGVYFGMVKKVEAPATPHDTTGGGVTSS